MTLLHLARRDVSVVVDARAGDLLPSIAYWGAPLGALTDDDLAALVTATGPIDPLNRSRASTAGILAEHARGGPEHPGVIGGRGGRDWSPRFAPQSVEHRVVEGADVVTAIAGDEVARLRLRLEIELTPQGLLRARAALTNADPSAPYELAALTPGLPIPARARETLDFGGRHGRERIPVRGELGPGVRLRETRHGRPGHDAAFLTVAGESGFGFRSGEVWGVHLAWSGSQRILTEGAEIGASRLGGGALFWPGEVVLTPGETYEGPWLVGSYARGLDAMSARFHAWVRAAHAGRPSRRAVTVNSWEAMYFDIDDERLGRLADAAAAVGAERFVLDDGWFGRRTDDTSSLGDWWLDPQRWPEGLHRLVDRVRGNGLEFGLWIEPEMVSPDSELARAHPDWVLAVAGREPVEFRHQLVLDLDNPDAYRYVLGRLRALIDEYRIDALKWDHNRPLVDAARAADGRPVAERQVRAAYRLMDELRAAYPALQIEGCASGGGRIDLELARRVDRFWPSDTTDPLERQAIQRWTALLIPPEQIGAHVARPASPTTGRVSTLGFRAGTALLADLGIEWDLTAADPAELALLREWVGAARGVRSLTGSGTVVRADDAPEGIWIHGVVAPDAREAIFAVVGMATTVRSTPGLGRFPGLDPALRYRVADVTPGGPVGRHLPAPTWAAVPPVLPGSVLATAGLELPAVAPEELRILRFTVAEPEGGDDAPLR